MTVLKKPLPQTRINQQMMTGHRLRMGHYMKAHLESNDGELWHLVYTCCNQGRN